MKRVDMEAANEALHALQAEAAARFPPPGAAVRTWPPDRWSPPEHALPDLEPDPDLCPDCSGRGWMVIEDGGAGAAKPCLCTRKSLAGERLERCMVPPKWRPCTIDNFHPDRASKPAVRDTLVGAKAISRRWLEHILKPRKGSLLREDGLLFVGPPGTGKTHLAAAVLMEAIRRYGVLGLFVDFTTLLARIHDSYRGDSAVSVNQILQPYLRAELLVIDELGAQKPTEHTMSILYLILNGRYSAQSATLFTSNYRLEDGNGKKAPSLYETLASRISAPLVSRLYEMGRAVPMGGWDYRKEVARFKVGR